MYRLRKGRVACERTTEGALEVGLLMNGGTTPLPLELASSVCAETPSIVIFFSFDFFLLL
jgi:hypothetical protein